MASDDDVPELVSSEEDASSCDCSHDEDDDFSSSDVDDSYGELEIEGLPQCLNMLAADKWQMVLNDPRRKGVHTEMIRNYCLGPFLFGRCVQPAKWMRWAKQCGFTGEITIEDVVTCKLLSEQELECVDILDDALDLVINYQYTIDDVKRLLDLISRLDENTADPDLALKEAHMVSHIADLSDKLGRMRKTGRRVQFAILYVSRQYAHNVSRITALHQDLDVEYQRDIEKQNKDIEVTRCQGNEFYNRGDFKSAIQKYSTALSRCALNHKCYGNRAQCYLTLQQYSRAALDARRSVALNPKWVKGYYRSAQAWCGLKNFARALKMNQRAQHICQSLPDLANATDRRYLDDQRSYIQKKIAEAATAEVKSMSTSEVDRKVAANNQKNAQSRNNNNYNNNTASNNTSNKNANNKEESNQKRNKNTQKSKKEDKGSESNQRSSLTPSPKHEVRNKRRDLDRFMNTLKLSVDSYMGSHPAQSSQGLRECLNKIKQNGVQYYNLSRVEEQIISYAEASSQIECSSYELISDAHNKLLYLAEGSTGLIAALSYYGMARTLVKQNRYREAESYLERALKSVPKKPADTVKCSPLVTLVSALEKSTIEDLLCTCRRPPVPQAQCRYQRCTGYHKTEIYLTDFDFEGYIWLKCVAKCILAYHPTCWKKLRSSYKDRHSEKDFLEKPCLTPDCSALIVEIKIYDRHHLLKRHYQREHVIEKKAKEKSREKANADKFAKDVKKREQQRERDLKAKQQLKDLKDLKDVIKERRTSERSVSERSDEKHHDVSLEDCLSTGGSTSVHTDADSISVGAADDHQSILPDEPMTVLKKNGEDYKVVERTKRRNKKKGKTTMSLTEFVGNAKADSSAGDGPVRTSESIPTSASKPDVKADDQAVEDLYDFFHEYLSTNGPTRVDDKTLVDILDGLPPVAQKLIEQRDGLATFLLYRLQFAAVDNYMCITRDIVKARKMADLDKGGSDTKSKAPTLNPEAKEFKPSFLKSTTDSAATPVVERRMSRDSPSPNLFQSLEATICPSPTMSEDFFNVFDEDLPYTSPVMELEIEEEKDLFDRVEQAKNVWDTSGDSSMDSSATGSALSSSYASFNSPFGGMSPFLSHAFSPSPGARSMSPSYAPPLLATPPTPLAPPRSIQPIIGTQAMIVRPVRPVTQPFPIQPIGMRITRQQSPMTIGIRPPPNVIPSPNLPISVQQPYRPISPRDARPLLGVPLMQPTSTPQLTSSPQLTSTPPGVALSSEPFSGYVTNAPKAPFDSVLKVDQGTQAEDEELKNLRREFEKQVELCNLMKELDAAKNKEIMDLKTSIKLLNDQHVEKCRRLEEEMKKLRNEHESLRRNKVESDSLSEASTSLLIRTRDAESELVELRLKSDARWLAVEKMPNEVERYLLSLKDLVRKCEECQVTVPTVVGRCVEEWTATLDKLRSMRARTEKLLHEQTESIRRGVKLSELPPIECPNPPQTPEQIPPQMWRFLEQQVKFHAFAAHAPSMMPPARLPPPIRPPPTGLSQNSLFGLPMPSANPLSQGIQAGLLSSWPPKPMSDDGRDSPKTPPGHGSFSFPDLSKFDNGPLGGSSTASSGLSSAASMGVPSTEWGANLLASAADLKVESWQNERAKRLPLGMRIPNSKPLAMTGGVPEPPPAEKVEFRGSSGSIGKPDFGSSVKTDFDSFGKTDLTDWPMKTETTESKPDPPVEEAQKATMSARQLKKLESRKRNNSNSEKTEVPDKKIDKKPAKPKSEMKSEAQSVWSTPMGSAGMGKSKKAKEEVRLEDDWSVVANKRGGAKKGAKQSTPVRETSASKTSFTKIMEELTRMFPSLNKNDLMGYIQRVRGRQDTLSGMSLEEMVEMVGDEVQLDMAKAESVKMMAQQKLPQPVPSAAPPLVGGVSRSHQAPPTPWGGAYCQTPPTDADMCIICHEDMRQERTVKLDCRHQFHQNCIKKWLREQSTCPTCRVHALLHDEYPRLG